MIEVLWHGRGGQGAFTAARLLGAAASFGEGRYALAFPSFGPERRGAPIRAFTKLGTAPINDRSALTRADYVLYLDDTLLGDAYASELKPGGRVIVNSTRRFDDPRIVALDANGLSQAILGRPIPNTALLGALAALCAQVSVDDLHEAVRQYLPPKLHEKNLRIITEAAVLVRAAGEDAPGEQEGTPATPAPEAPCATPHEEATAVPPRGDVRIPVLRANPVLDPAVYARSTCFEAGHLVSVNAGWRNVRPVVDVAACTRCGMCCRQCPDGALYLAAPAGGAGEQVVVDLDFCKGCGICARACALKAITMTAEAEA